MHTGINCIGQRKMECTVCREPYGRQPQQRVPRSLRCGHTFCGSCLQSMLNQVPERRAEKRRRVRVYGEPDRAWVTNVYLTKRIRCPLCRSSSDVRVLSGSTSGYVERVAINWALMNLVHSETEEKAMQRMGAPGLVVAQRLAEEVGGLPGVEDEIIDDVRRASVALQGSNMGDISRRGENTAYVYQAGREEVRHGETDVLSTRQVVIRESRTHGRGYVSLQDVQRELEGARHEIQQLRTERGMRATVHPSPLRLAEENRELKARCESLKECYARESHARDRYREAVRVAREANTRYVDELTADKKALKTTINEQVAKLDEANDSLRDMGVLNAKKNALQKALDKETASHHAAVLKTRRQADVIRDKHRMYETAKADLYALAAEKDMMVNKSNAQ